MGARGVLLLLFALTALGTTTKCPKRRTSPVKEVLCYTSTFDLQLLADSVCSCTTLVHQNHDLWNFSISEIVNLRKSLREMHPPLQFVISMYDPATTLKTSAMVRQEAIARIIAAVKEVDGIEMNVTAGSKERLYNFVKSLKDEMIRKSYDKRILVALPSKPEDLAKQFNLKELAKYVDLFTLPTDYLTDKDGAFVTFHPSRLMGLFDMLNSDSMVDLISELGAPKRKILMTLPANAYKFTLKEETDNTPRSQTTEKDPTPIDRKELCKAINSGEWTVERDEDLTAPYAFQNKTWIAFEDKISVGIKGKYALVRDLAGLAVRNIESDMKTECERSLTQEIYHSFTEFKRKSRQAVLNALEDELHQTQFSYPTQAKTSSFRVVRVVDTEGHIRAVRENTQTEFVCRRQGYFVHPKSCNRFYRCVKFNQAVEDYSVFEFDCPAGLSFDESTEVCVWPGSLPQGSPCPGSSEIAPVAPRRFECSRAGYFADPGNCRWFFACMDLGGPELMAFEFRCPYGLVFDETKLVCEWPWLVPACSESGSSYTRTEYDYRGHTAGISTGIGTGGYVTGGLPEYSATAGTGYSNIDYSKTTGGSTHGVSYFGGSTTGYIDERAGISNFNGKTVSGNVGFSGSAGVDYTGSTRGYGESVSSIPTYGSPGVHVGLVSPGTIVEEGRTGYTAGKTSTGHTISGYSTGGIANTGAVGGIGSGYSGGQYSGTVSGSHLTNDGTIYSGTYRPSYTSSVAGGYTGSTSNSIAEGETYSKTSGTNYFGPTGLPGSTGVHISSLGPKYGEPTSLHTGSGAIHAGGYSSTDVYSGTGHGIGHQTSSVEVGPSFGTVSGPSYSRPIGGIDITGSTDRGYTGSTAEIYRQSTGAGYSKTTDRIGAGFTGTRLNVPSSTSSGRIPEIDFTSGISTFSGHGVTSADNGYFINGNIPPSGATGISSTGIRYENKEGYTVPVFVHQQPIYPSVGTTAFDVKGHTGTTSTNINVADDYGRNDLARPNLNISIFGHEIPTDYDVQKGSTGAILTESSIQGSIHTGDAFSGTVFSHGNIPGAVSTPTINQGSILTGGAQSGYITTSSGTSGHVIRDGIKTVNVESGNSGTLIYGTPTPSISLTGPSTSGVVLKGDATPSVVFSGQTAPGVSIGGSIQPGIIQSSTGKPFVSQPGNYYGISGNSADTRGSVTYSSSTLHGDLTPPHTTPHSYKADEEHDTLKFNTAYDINRYSGNDIPDYRPTSAILPDSIVPAGKIEIFDNVNIHGSTLIGVQDSSTVAPGYSSTKSSVFTPSGFTKTGPTRTGITTAILGGGGSYSVSTSERQPILNPDNISEKAFEGNVGYKTSPGYSSTLAPIGRITPQSGTSGYSYPKPTIPFETGSATFSSTPIAPFKNYLPVTTPRPFLNVQVPNGALDNTNVFGSKVFTTSHRGSSTPTSIIYTTEYPETYKTTLFEAAKIPVSTVRPIIDTGYKTVIAPTNIPLSTLTDNGFTQRTGGLQSQTVTTSNIGLGVPFQRTDSNSQKDYSSFTSPSPSLGYLPAKSSQPDTIASTVKYDGPRVTVRPDIVGVTYKKPYESPSSVISPTTFRPSNGYYAGQGFTTPSLVGTTPGGGSPTNLDISRDKIDKLITNYDRGTVKYTTNVYDNLANSRFGSTSTKILPSSLLVTKLSSPVKTGDVFAITTSTAPTTYEVTTKSPEGKGKVIVKWSDLHPLLLGKLGAECTCKADPFGTLRGPIRKLIDSSRGKVDLANYDESNIYVDLEKDRSYEDSDYSNNYDDSQPYKISPHETTSVTTNSPNLPSSSYLPVSSTTVSPRGFVPAIATGTSAKSDNFRGSSRFQVGSRAGKKLENISPSPNSFASYEEEEEEDDPDQIIDGATNCARPGLFRHPGLCNKFYACYWDQWKKRFTLHIFNCPIHLTFDSNASACNWPSKGPACQADNFIRESGILRRLRLVQMKEETKSKAIEVQVTRESVVKVKVVRARRSKSRKAAEC